MTTTYWVLLVVALLLLLLILFVVGYARRKKNTITFEEKKAPEELTQKDKSGDYQASGGFNFSPAQGTVQEERQKQPVLRGDQDLQSDSDSTELDATELAQEQLSVEPGNVVADEAEAMPASDLVKDTDSVVEVEPEAEAEADPETETEPPVEWEIVQPAPEVVVAPPTQPEPAEPGQGERREAAKEKVVENESQLDEIAPAEGRIHRLRGRLSRSQNAIGQSVLGILGAGDLDEDAWEEIEDTLIMADLGTKSTVTVVEKLRERIASRGVSSEAEARALLREVLIEECQPDMDRSIRALPHEGKPAVILVVGVNGTGKTTTTGKLARVLVSGGHKVVLGAADTFRAAAADQLETWGRRVGAETVRGAEGADPASIAFDAVKYGVDNNADVVLIDTAGRLHTKVGLMDQLDKIKRVVEKKAQVDEVILVLDATVGQNGLMQARTFRDVVDITGVALTKLDGTAKGGIIFQVQHELGVPVKLVGLGEGADHLAPFEVDGFVDALLGKN